MIAFFIFMGIMLGTAFLAVMMLLIPFFILRIISLLKDIHNHIANIEYSLNSDDS